MLIEYVKIGGIEERENFDASYVLARGELAVRKYNDGFMVKIGDGVSKYSNLPWEAKTEEETEALKRLNVVEAWYEGEVIDEVYRVIDELNAREHGNSLYGDLEKSSWTELCNRAIGLLERVKLNGQKNS